MSPFTPAGDRARWRVIYEELLSKARTGDIITYEAMAEKLNLNADEDRHVLQMAMRRAAREHLLVDSRAVEAVRNSGYRIVEPEVGLVLAKQHQRKAIRSVRRGHDHVIHVDMSELAPDIRLLFEAAAFKFAEQEEALRRLDIRQQRQQQQIAAAASGLERTADQIARLEARLAALETGRES